VWLERLEREHANLRAALQWALERHAGEVAVRLSGALFRFWEARKHLQEGRTFLERALLCGQDVEARVRAKALVAASFLAKSWAAENYWCCMTRRAIRSWPPPIEAISI
jgi:hypothetical protein